MQYIDTVPEASKKGTLLTRNGKPFRTAYGVGYSMDLTSDLTSKLGYMKVINEGRTLQVENYLNHGERDWVTNPFNCVIALPDAEASTWNLYLSSYKDLSKLVLD
jgi:hypothetical protein